nr:hypothetical protein [Tanacetum cinerariifolium]
MSNNQTNTSSALHNAIMKDGGKDRPPLLAPDPPTRASRVMETYPTVSEENMLNIDAEAESCSDHSYWD